MSAQARDLVEYVNTLQGTNSNIDLTRGNTYPTTTLPFGMHTWTPQTGKNGDGWKYQYDKNSIRGFQQAHQCSSWTRDYCVFSLMPETGSLVVDEDARAAQFRHVNEIARPNYYAVKLDNGITTEMAPTERGAHLRFTFPDSKSSYLVLDGYTGDGQITIIPSEKKITGYVHNGQYLPNNFKSYFEIVFDRPFVAWGTWKKGDANPVASAETIEGKEVGAYIQFDAGEKVQAKVASSYISAGQASLTLKTELGAFSSLEDTKNAAAEVWNNHLGKILVEGETEDEKATFYSCFYRASLFPREFFEYDENSQPYYFSPYDGKVHKGYMYTDTGFWDTFRAQFPLNVLLYPKMHGQYMHALLDAYQQMGRLPSWSFPGESGSMIGNHAISLLTDAWAKGIHTFDPELALKAYQHEITTRGGGRLSDGRSEWQDYEQLGYVPYPEHPEATAKTLEYAYDDFCGYQLAKMTDHQDYEQQFAKYMYNYKNVYNPSTGFVQGKNRAGEWSSNFDPTEWGGPFTEGCAWHWEWSVFHDIQGLINLMGGDKNFTDKLDAVFTAPNTYKVGTYNRIIHEMREMAMINMGQYAHGNEPIEHMAYLYNYAGQPWQTQRHVRGIMSKLYDATENGYPGDEDEGQLSSWYVLSALGIYSVCPGTDQYVVGSPVFDKATITFENDKKFVIHAENNSHRDVYIQSATLNGNEYIHNYLTYGDITAGGLFDLNMSDQPNTTRGIEQDDRPFSLSK